MIINIKKLFGERDYILELNEKMNIFVGENGSGKSTILKMINCLFSGDLLTLSKIDFESISLNIPCSTNFKYVEYVDSKPINKDSLNILVKKEDIVQLDCVKDAKFKFILRDLLNEYDFEKDIESKKINFDNFLSKLNSKFKKEKSGIKIIPNMEINYDDDINVYFNIDTSKITLDNINDFMPSLTFDENITNLYIRSFDWHTIPYGCKMYLYNVYLSFVRIWLLRKYNIKHDQAILKLISANDSVIKTKVNSSIVFKICYTFYENIKSDIFKSYYDCSVLKFKNIIAVAGKYDGELTGEDKQKIMLMHNLFNNELCMLTKLFSTSKVEDYVQFKEDRQYYSKITTDEKFMELLKDLSCDLNLDIDYNYITFYDMNKYSIEQLEKVKFILKNIKAIYNQHSEIRKIFENEDYNTFIKMHNADVTPTLSYDKEKLKSLSYSREQFIIEMSHNIDKYLKNNHLDLEKNLKNYIFSIDKIIDKCQSLDMKKYYNSKQAQLFYELANKYFLNKNFMLYYGEDNNILLKIYDKKTGVEIKENYLSSGEYKMLRIIKNLAFNNNDLLIFMDEPELSLSVYWQKMLLDDILKNTNGIVFLATQSTNIVNESHFQYLKEVSFDE